MVSEKAANQDWQSCALCGTWWPVDTDFATLRAEVETECPTCHASAPFAPSVMSKTT